MADEELRGMVSREEMGRQVQEKVKEAIRLKDQEIALINRQLEEHRTKAASVDDLASRLAQAESQLRQAKDLDSLRKAKIPDHLHADFLTLYRSSQAGKETPAELDDWLSAEDGAAASPLLATYLPKPGEEGQEAQAQETTVQTKHLPNSNVGASPGAAPAGQGKPTPEQILQIALSPEVQSLPAAERKAKIAELQRSVGEPVAPYWTAEK